ncbi:MAG: serine hydrolase domain-containing protein [Myxococcales bacterium]
MSAKRRTELSSERYKMRKCSCACVFGSCVLAALLTSPLLILENPAHAAPATPPQDSTSLQAAIDALVRAPEGPAGVIVVIDNGSSTRVQTAGVASTGTKPPPTADGHLRVASLTKAMTAAVALRLVEEGTLRLGDTVGDWLPELPAAWHDVSLLQLLNHTSGVPDFAKNPAVAKAISESPTVAPTPSEILAYAGNTTDFPAGARYEYSNSNPFITGLIIQAATGKQYEDVLRAEVLEPLGMKDTYLPAFNDPKVPAPVTRGYQVDDGQREDVTELVAFGGWGWSSGGVVSTPADLTKFVRGYVGGELFGETIQETQHDSMQPGNSDPEGPGRNSAGAGLFTYQTRCGMVYGHTGSVLGYTLFMAATGDGERSVAFAVTTQISDNMVSQLRVAQELAVCAALE